jgi:hypothetical protein
MTAEQSRLAEAIDGAVPWRKWGPYLSERLWGTGREDYRESGDAWDHFSHDQARSRAYRWGGDGLAGISDDRRAEADEYYGTVIPPGLDADGATVMRQALAGLMSGKQYYSYFGNDFTVECPTGPGRRMNLYQVAEEIARRLAAIFLRGPDGRRPVYGATEKFQTDPHWRNQVLFYEYFHGDNGAGLGASHQTGWTAIVARTMHLFATLTPEQMLDAGKQAYFRAAERARPGRPATVVAP